MPKKSVLKQGTTPPQKKQKSQPLPIDVINLSDDDESHNSEGSAAVEAGRRAKPHDLSEGPIFASFWKMAGRLFMRKEGLRLTGNKPELVERVQNHLKVPQNGNVTVKAGARSGEDTSKDESRKRNLRLTDFYTKEDAKPLEETVKARARKAVDDHRDPDQSPCKRSRLTGSKPKEVCKSLEDGGPLDKEEEEEEEEKTGRGTTQRLKLPDAKVCQYVADGGELGKLPTRQLELYLRQNGMRMSGTKEEIIDRIKLHVRLKREGGQALFPRWSFTINYKGDVCKGDIVLFQQHLCPEDSFDYLSRTASMGPMGVRTVAGSVTKEAYGHLEERHTFTIEVLWTSGPRPLQVIKQLRIKGLCLYKIETLRQPRYDEEERKAILDEKHERGAAACAKRSGKVKRVRDTESIPASPPKTPKIYKTHETQIMGIEPIGGAEQQGYKVKTHKTRTKSITGGTEKQEDNSSFHETHTGSIAGGTKSKTCKTHKTSTEPISAGNEEQVYKVRIHKTHETQTGSIAGGGIAKQHEYKGRLSQQETAPNDTVVLAPTQRIVTVTPDQNGIQRSVTVVRGLPEQQNRGCCTPHCNQRPAKCCSFPSCGTCCPRGGLCKKHGERR